MLETRHLLRSPANAKRLLRSIRNARAGRLIERDMMGAGGHAASPTARLVYRVRRAATPNSGVSLSLLIGVQKCGSTEDEKAGKNIFRRGLRA
jgi:hypothetical protein